jgi:hypothetical protein
MLSRSPESSSLPKDLNPKDLDEFIPPLNSGRVIKVYDGDSITVASKVSLYGLLTHPHFITH